MEMHPYLAQDALNHLAGLHSIAVTAYSSLGPQSYIELEMHKDVNSLLQHDAVLKIASNHKKSECHRMLH
jgi:D-xylose reductase